MVTVIREGTSKDILDKVLAKLKFKKGFPSKKYSGVIKLKDSPIVIQKKMRDEWK
ncbi:hypothetical protein BH11BAC7_BH11BAC7_25750 [soil metagenome]